MRGLSALKSGMISQLFRSLRKFVFVGVIQTIESDQIRVFFHEYHRLKPIHIGDDITMFS